MKSYLKTKDYSITGEAFELFHDEELDMLVTRPEPKALEKYYQSEVYISHTDSSKSLIDKVYQVVKRFSISKKVSLINAYTGNKKTILDVGAGTGDFLVAAKKDNWMVAGVEPNEDAREKANEKGVPLHNDLEDVKGKKFDVITLWHVLEHLPGLEDQIKKITNLLQEDGTLIIAVPNFKSYDAGHYQNFWAAYDVPRHLWHFSRTAIERLFIKHEMELVKTKPMIFDAFYVALLSEKYKSGKSNFIKAFWIGFRSNLSAWRSKEYSSIIYVLKKR